MSSSSDNPYVGPRALREGETLYSRDEEMRDLADLLVAQRIVLLHAPSGAGKTSLIQAGLLPLMWDKGFAPTPALRVNTPGPKNGKVANAYVYSLASYLLGADGGPENLRDLSLPDLLERLAARDDERTPLLVIDQFEEILTIDPTDRAGQDEFFCQLGEGLAKTGAWALLSMREDYMGGLARFTRYVPGHLAITRRLDFLDRDGAMEAIRGPAEELGVEFAEKAAAELVRRLAIVRVQSPGRGEVEVEAPYVHPFQLQVVCSALWRAVRKEREGKATAFRDITLKDVKEHADVARALQLYYSGVVEWVAGETKADEGVIRRWFQTELITPQHFRSQTLTGPASGEVDPRKVLQELERAYLIRSDTREGTWYELSHDQLIRPILVANESWERPRLNPWQLAARAWEDNRDPWRLIGGLDLYRAQRQAEHIELTHTERSFLEASRQAEHDRSVLDRMRSRLGLVYVIAIVLGLLVLALGVVIVLLAT